MPPPGNMIIRYQTQPSTADENTRLVEAVFASLADLKPSHLLQRCDEPPAPTEATLVGSDASTG